MATYFGQTVDIYEDFEDALSGWTETDPDSNIDPASTTLKYAGAQSLQFDMNGASAGGDVFYIGCDTGGNKSSISFGFWFYATNLSAAYNTNLFAFTDNIANHNKYHCQLNYRENPDGELRIRNAAAAFSGTITLPSMNAWYWVTIQSVLNATCSMNVYDTTGTQVGATVTVAGSNNAARYPVFGADTARDYDDMLYFDDFVADYTYATFPLLGWAAAGGANYIPAIYHMARMRAQ